jgi:hypothetical protein
MHHQGAHSQASEASRPAAPAASTGMPTMIGPADRAHSSGNGPVEFSGSARARPVTPIARSLFDLPSVALRVIGLAAPATGVVVQVLVPVCGPPM